MLDVSPEIATLILFGGLFLLLATGLHVVFALGGICVIGILLLWGPHAFSIVASGALAVMNFYTLVAIPFFIFMAVLLQASGIAEAMFKSIRFWFGRIPGGLAMGVVFICTIIAAMSGITGTGVITMGILALPIMLRLGYDKSIAIGPILAGGALGILIPPSVSFIIFGSLAQVSIGKLFLGGVIPGLILSAMYIAYIGIRCYFQPELGPPLPPEERGSLRDKILSLRSIAFPALLIMAVLGTIFLGIASPTEAAAVGAVGALVAAAINRRLTWSALKDAVYTTFRASLMVMWILIGAYAFKSIFVGVGGPGLAQSVMGGLDVAPIIIVLIMMGTYMVMGCFLDEITQMLITIPVYMPILASLGFDPVWFGVLFLINMQMAYLTPPFGGVLFYMKGVAPPGVTMADIYRSVGPFLPLQFTVLMLVLFFPQLALWLPNLVFG